MSAGSVTPRLPRVVGWLGRRVDPLGDPSASMETMSVLDSHSTSIMPRTPFHQGRAAGVHALSARYLGLRVDAAGSRMPERADETLRQSGVDTGGVVVRSAAVSGALYDVACLATSSGRSSSRRPVAGIAFGAPRTRGAR